MQFTTLYRLCVRSASRTIAALLLTGFAHGQEFPLWQQERMLQGPLTLVDGMTLRLSQREIVGDGTTFEWRKGNTILTNTGAELLIADIRPDDAGTYRLKIKEGDQSRISVAQEINVVGHVIYSADFESSDDPHWSHSLYFQTAAGAPYGRALGDFSNDHVTLTLDGMTEERTLYVSADVLVLRSWDGIELNWGGWGYDFWVMGVENGPELVRTTFSNNAVPSSYYFWQSYPFDYPYEHSPPGTGAVYTNLNGQPFGAYPFSSAVYRVGAFIEGGAAESKVYFEASGLQAKFDEAWALDNVRVVALDAAAEAISFASTTFTAHETATALEVTVERHGNLERERAVEVRFESQTAKDGVDYFPPAGTIAFRKGEKVRTLIVPLGLDNTKEETNRTFFAVLTTPDSNLVPFRERAACIIVDDDSPFRFGGGESVLEDMGTITVGVSLGRPSPGDRSVKLVQTGGNAILGVDYNFAPQTESWISGGPGVRSIYFHIQWLTNASAGPHKTLELQLTNGIGAPISTARRSITIYDDDGDGRGYPPIFLETPANTALRQGETRSFTAKAKGEQPITFYWNKSGRGKQPGDTFTLTQAQATDEGNYSLLASNAVAQFTMSFRVYVRDHDFVPIRFTGVQLFPDQTTRVEFEGETNVTLFIEGSPDLKRWERLPGTAWTSDGRNSALLRGTNQFDFFRAMLGR